MDHDWGYPYDLGNHHLVPNMFFIINQFSGILQGFTMIHPIQGFFMGICWAFTWHLRSWSTTSDKLCLSQLCRQAAITCFIAKGALFKHGCVYTCIYIYILCIYICIYVYVNKHTNECIFFKMPLCMR